MSCRQVDWPADEGLGSEPHGNARIGGPPAAHDPAALAERAAEVFGDVPEGGQRSLFEQETTGNYENITDGGREPAAPVQIAGHILDAHQESILHRVHVQNGRDRATIARDDASYVIGGGAGIVNTMPPEQLGTPGDIGVFAVGEESGIEEIASI